ncbi:MAG: hypothetical protein L0Y56_20980 [Nitrospira sp.]|nr:hypothetical protein [Nitrospira sp.]
MARYLWISLISISFLLGACGYGRVTQGPADALIGEKLKANQAECWWIGMGPTCPETEKK